MSVGTFHIDVDMSSPGATLPGLPAPAPAPHKRPLRAKAMSREMRAQSHRAGGWGPGGYDASQRTRTSHDWFTFMMSGDAAMSVAWEGVTSRTRDLVRNNAIAAGAVTKIVDNTVGDMGIQSESIVEFDGADDNPLDVEQDEKASAFVDRRFNHWAEHECDAEGRMNWAEMQAMAIGEAPQTGNAFLVAVNKPAAGRSIPLAFQCLEAEQLLTNLDRPRSAGQNKVKRGIEFNEFDEPIAYHFWTNHPYDLVQTSLDTVRVPANRVIHFFEKGGQPRRPSQTAGISWFSPILMYMRDLGCYVGDEIDAARIAQYFVVAINRAAGAGTGLGFAGDDEPSDSDQDGNPLTDLGSGIVADLGKDDKVTTIQSNRPNSQAETFINLLLSVMANGLGMTYLQLTGDVRQANYSSARFARLQDKDMWRTLQARTGRHLVLPVRYAVVKQLAAFGRIPDLTPITFRANPWRWLKTDLLPPGWEEVDETKGVAAAIERIKAGLSTLQEEGANRGRHWRRLLQQRAREIQTTKKLGLTLSVDQQEKALVPTPSAETVDEDEQQQGGQRP